MFNSRVISLLLAGTAVAAAGGAAHAAGTTAGTPVNNQAQASYTVNGSPQTASSNVASFVVDRKVNLTVIADQAANTTVNLSQTGAVTTFKVTNNTNAVQDFILDADQNVGIGGTGTDNFDVTNVKVYVDSNGNGVYDANVDTATYIDELAADASATVFVVADVPNQANASVAIVSLQATVAAAGAPGTKGAALVPTALNLLNQDNEVDIVFADGDSDGLTGADIVRNGQGRAYLGYEIGAHNVNLSVAKTATVISDGVSAVNPKAIPGAVVQYCLTVSNATLLTPATNVNLTDVIPANTTYVPGSITVGGLGLAGACVLNGFAVNDDGSAVALSPYGGSFNGVTKTVTAVIPTLLGGTSVAASFKVTIN